ncbi:MAG: hypothetical protein PHR66_07945 [Desulfuromonadaceae bacterium]|nr:hypothetical protein [Desulfuromonadaceae bacterium]
MIYLRKDQEIPEAILPELRAQFKVVGELHDRNLIAGYDGVFLDDAVEKKYPKAQKDNHDLYSLRSGQDNQRTKEPTGFLNSLESR